MTKKIIENCKAILPFVQAVVDGKEIEEKMHGGEWQQPSCNCMSFGEDYEYRIKPEPKLRPWTAEEFPINCVLKQNKSDMVYRPCSWDKRGVSVTYKPCGSEDYSIESAILDFEALANFYKYTINNTNWQPCGVLD